LAALLSLSRKTVSARINSLKEKGLIERMGSDKRGTWRLNDSAEVTEKATEGVTEKVTERVTEKERDVLKCIEHNPTITSTELAALLSLSRKTVSARINSLKEKGLIERIGSDKKGAWRINDN
jgi:predicted HTH transcriptional regulator